MRLRNLKFVFCLIFVTGCERTSKLDKTAEVEQIITERRGISEMQIISKNMVKDYYSSQIFALKDSSQNLQQELGILSMTPDSLKFVLVTRDQRCELHFSGYAIKNSLTDSVARRTLNGLSEYATEGQQYLMRIIVNNDERIARIIYSSKRETEMECPLPVARAMELTFP